VLGRKDVDGMMDKEIEYELKRILNWWRVGDFTDENEIEKELNGLLEKAYERGVETGRRETVAFADNWDSWNVKRA
jgi:hypothetical protein